MRDGLDGGFPLTRVHQENPGPPHEHVLGRKGLLHPDMVREFGPRHRAGSIQPGNLACQGWILFEKGQDLAIARTESRDQLVDPARVMFRMPPASPHAIAVEIVAGDVSASEGNLVGVRPSPAQRWSE